jgi:dihydrofolate synthase/folylpolyglutamate synthase
MELCKLGESINDRLTSVKNKSGALLRELYSLRQFPKKQSLENITILCDFLGNPQRTYPTIHLAGTNGKGSTAYLIYLILKAHGLKTGLYTSPHLQKFNERIRINDQFISDEQLVRFWEKIKPVVHKINATFFDATTALAFDYFHRQTVDLAVIETGLGGRLDSTNIITPAAAVITPIDFDHMKYLGHDLITIGKEKAAIIKPGATAFSAGQQQEISQLLQQYGTIRFTPDAIKIETIHLEKQYSTFTLYDQERQICLQNLRLALAGHHQLENLALAYQVIRWYLETIQTAFDAKIFTTEISRAAWPGRFQRISQKPEIIVDVCHNTAGFRRVVEHISKTYRSKEIHLLLGLIDDKSYDQIVEIIAPVFASITITEPIHTHPLPGKLLQTELKKFGIKALFIKDMMKAFEFSKKGLAEEATLFILGSHYLIGNLGHNNNYALTYH